MGQLVDIELNKKLFKNIDEQSLTNTYASLENCFVTEANGISRFPGLLEFTDLGGNNDVYIDRYQNDMVAVDSNGQVHVIDQNGEIRDHVDGPHVLGGRRVSFARTRDGMIMAAGAQIIKFNGKKTSVLSENTPLSSHVGFIDGYVLAVENDSGRFQHTEANNFSSWPALNTFAVDGAPDNINAMLISPFNEILLSGEESLEQYERYIGGEVPFFRRWSVGEGISEPGTLCWADNAAWGLNARREFVRLSGQTSQSVSDDLQKDIEHRYSLADIGAFDKAWAAPVYTKGQKFIIFQSPKATNAYGTTGFTAVFDIRRGQWFEIFGWDAASGVPDLWPGRSVLNIWGKTFIGGVGKIYELSPTTYNNDGAVQRAYVRTAHFDTLGCMRVNAIRITIKRGVGSYTISPKIGFRSNPDNRGFGRWQYHDLGKTGAPEMIIEFGPQGIADTWQFEWFITDNCPFEMRRLQADVTGVDR